MGDLLSKLAEDPQLNLTVLCGSIFKSTNHKGPTPKFYNSVCIIRIPTLNLGKRNFINRILGYFTFYLGVFGYLLFGKRYHLVVSLSTPPLIGFLVAFASRLRKTPFVYYVQDLYPELLFDMGHIQRVWILKKLWVINDFILNHAAKVFVISEDMKRKLITNYNFEESKLVYIPNWSGKVTYQTPKNRKNFVILYSGNMGLAHDFSMLGPLVELLWEEQDVQWHFVGGGANTREVQDIFYGSHENRVTFEDYVPIETHCSVLASANLVLLAQKEETVGDILPSKFYSYLAAGRPLLFLGPYHSEIGHMILENGLGLVVEIEEDLPGVVSAILDMKNDPAYHLEYCIRAKTFYEEKFGLESSLQIVRQELQKLIE